MRAISYSTRWKAVLRKDKSIQAKINVSYRGNSLLSFTVKQEEKGGLTFFNTIVSPFHIAMASQEEDQ
jgi:hypothetical protein